MAVGLVEIRRVGWDALLHVCMHMFVCVAVWMGQLALTFML